MGLAWGATPSTSISDLVVLIVLSFSVINLSSVIGAQANTLSDRELDSMDERKKHLGAATNSFGLNRLKRMLAVEFALIMIRNQFSITFMDSRNRRKQRQRRRKQDNRKSILMGFND